jgi:hypothetical protein
MAKHNVFFELPNLEISKVDAHFNIIKDGEKLGRITISKGGFEYFPSKAKKAIKINWTQFDKMITKWNEG